MENFGAVRKIACIHDMSCLGRCSLSVVIPVLSVMGFQAVALPTALLSTHTGGFTDFTFLDLTSEMERMCAHWQRLGVTFDAFYSGFLGCEEQIETVSSLIANFAAPGALVLVDPVLGDDGRLYQTITDGLCRRMRELVSRADVITPNITEALLLLGESPERHLEQFEPSLLTRLSGLGPSRVVVTGVRAGYKLGTASYDRSTGETRIYLRERIDHSYPGTGDIFASVLLGRMMAGETLGDSAAFASDFVCGVMLDSLNTGTEPRYGVRLEPHLRELCGK